ncbi:MAG: hypothetical protein U1A77_00170 [Pirellulales bacterium]
MHETTRRFCCRAGFLLGCVLPTMLVVLWCGYLNSSWYREAEREAWRESLGQYLGVEVLIERVVHPEPRVTWLEGVTLVDPETDAKLASVTRVELGREAEGWVAFLGDADIPRSQLSRLNEIAHPMLWRRTTGAAPIWQVVVASLQVSSPDEAFTLLDVQLEGRAGEGESTDPQLQVEFKVAGVTMRQPAQLTITRQRHNSPPTTAWAFTTGPQALPASLLAIAWPELRELGADCQISGHCLARESANGWAGEAQGRLTQVDLDQAITGRFPHKLSGIADLVVSRLRWEKGRVVDAAGTVASAGGVVSQSLLVAAGDEAALQWSLPERVLESRQSLWKYRELACGFELTSQGLQITGQCESHGPGVILADVEGAMASEGRQPWISAVSLVRMLAPQQEFQVPATSSTEGLLRHLPLPSAVGPTTTIARPSYSPLKLR